MVFRQDFLKQFFGKIVFVRPLGCCAYTAFAAALTAALTALAIQNVVLTTAFAAALTALAIEIFETVAIRQAGRFKIFRFNS